jgi:Cu/Ag efflux protein CusF
MSKAMSRSAFMGFVAAAAVTMVGAPVAFAQNMDLVVPRAYENFKRGTLHSLDPSTRGFVVVWDDLGRVKMKASDLVVKSTTSGSGNVSNSYSELQDGQVCDIHWYDYVDFLVAKTTPEVTAKAAAMVSSGARAEGIPGTEHQIRLFSMAGMVTKIDPAGATMTIVNPNSGEIIQVPQIRSADGQAALKTFQPGDAVTLVYSIQTALSVKIIR